MTKYVLAVVSALFLSVCLHADEMEFIQIKNSWDYPPVWETVTDGTSTIVLASARGKYGNCLEISYELNGPAPRWVELKNKTIGKHAASIPVVCILKADAPSFLEIRFIDKSGSLFVKKVNLSDSYREWTQLVVFENALEFRSGDNKDFSGLKEVSFAITGAGKGKIWLDETGYGKAGMKPSFPPAGPDLDPKRTKGGIGFEQRRSDKLFPEDPLGVEWLKQVQDTSSPDKLLVPVMEDNTAQTSGNSLAAMTYILKGERARAERILDFYAGAAKQDNADKSLQNFFVKNQPRGFYQSVLLTTATVPAYHDLGTGNRDIGDMAWLLLACSYHEKTYRTDRYKALIAMLKSYLLSLYRNDGQGGYVQSGWRSGDTGFNDIPGQVRENIVCAAALRQCGETAVPENIRKWLDSVLKHRTNLPLDIHALRVLAFGEKYADLLDIPEFDLRYRKTLTVGEQKVMGLFHSADSSINNIWIDGLGQMACAYYSCGDHERGNFYANQIDPFLFNRTIDEKPVRALPAAANTQGGFEWMSADKGFTSTMAWYIFAKSQFNPLALERSSDKVVLHKKENDDTVGTITASSSENDSMPPSNIMDASLQTFWNSTVSDQQWIQIDRKQPVSLSGIVIHWGPAYAKAYDVALSEDGKAWKTAYTTADGEGGIDDLYFTARKIRSLRIILRECALFTGYSMSEVTLKDESESPDIDASSAGSSAGKVLDGTLGTSWKCKKGGRQWVQIDLRKEKSLGGVEISWGKDFATDFEVLLSTDKKYWRPVFKLSQGKGYKDLAYFERSMARYLRFNFLSGHKGAGYEIREIALKGPDKSATPRKIYELAAAKAFPGAYPRWLYKQQSYWTMTGAEGDDTESLLSEDGDIEPFDHSYSLTPFFAYQDRVISSGRAEVTQALERGYLPLPSVTWNTDVIRLTEKIFTVGNADNAATYVWCSLENKSSDTVAGTFSMAIRPFQVNPPWQFGGLSEIKTLRYSVANATSPASVSVNGQSAVISFTPPDNFGARRFKEGDIVSDIEAWSVPRTRDLYDENNYASGVLTYDTTLTPGGKKDYFFLLTFPLESVDELLPLQNMNVSVYLNQRYRELIASWENRLNRIRITVPDPAISSALKTNVAYILLNRDDERLQSGPRNARWSRMRDGAAISSALLRMGYAREVRDYINWMCSLQSENGMVPFLLDGDSVPEQAARLKEYDSQGQLISTLMEYYRFTRDREFLENKFAVVKKALTALSRLRRQNLTDVLKNGEARRRVLYGILPESNGNESYFPAQHSYWDNFWSLKGFKDALEMAQLIGSNETAAWIEHELRDYRTCLYDSLRIAIESKAVDYIPGCTEKGDFDAPSTAIAVFPCGELRNLPALQLRTTFSKYYDEIFLPKLSPSWSGITQLADIRTGMAYLCMDQEEQAQSIVRHALKSMRPRPWNQLSEILYSDYRHPQYIGDMPHSRSGAELITLIRSLFIREDGGRVILGQGIETGWLGGPDGVSIKGMPTFFGQVSYQAYVKDNVLKIDVSGSCKPPEGFVFRIPRGIKAVSAEVNGKPVTIDTLNNVRFTALPAKILIRQ